MSQQLMFILIAQAALLIWYFGFLRQQLFIDEYRQRLFILRDSLFDDALAGKVSFDDGAYKKVRSRINGLIRYSEDLNFLRIIVGAVLFRFSPSRNEFKSMLKEYEEEFNEELASLGEEKRLLLKAAEVRSMTLTIIYILKSSFLMGPLISALILGLRFAGAASRMSTKLDGFVRKSQFSRNISSEAQILGTHSKRYGFNVATH